jgi:hypothetical protein
MNLIDDFRTVAGRRAGGALAGGEVSVACACSGAPGARNIITLWNMSGSPFSDAYRRTQAILKP